MKRSGRQLVGTTRLMTVDLSMPSARLAFSAVRRVRRSCRCASMCVFFRQRHKPLRRDFVRANGAEAICPCTVRLLSWRNVPRPCWLIHSPIRGHSPHCRLSSPAFCRVPAGSRHDTARLCVSDAACGSSPVAEDDRSTDTGHCGGGRL